jgi:hypothetical protein
MSFGKQPDRGLRVMAIILAPQISDVSAGETARIAYRRYLFTAVVLLGLSGLVIGQITTPAAAIEPELTRLLRFMAVVKLGMVSGATWLVAWRLSWPCPPYLARGYLIALALTAICPGLIWFMSYLPGAIGVFHVGTLLGIVLALRDKGTLTHASHSEK